MKLDKYKNFKITQAFVFLLIPFVLIIVNQGVLDSISAYAYYKPMVFGQLLSLAGALFVYDGFFEKKRWYNIYVGLSLCGVVLFPHLDYPIIHYLCAGVFFLGSLFNMVYFSSNKQRLLKGLTALIVLFGMSGCFIFNWYSIFWAEWFGMVPISIHYVLELTGKID
jgi:hypothetical protein